MIKQVDKISESQTPAADFPAEAIISELIAKGSKNITVSDVTGQYNSDATDASAIRSKAERELALSEELIPVVPGESYAVAEKMFNNAEFLIVPDALEIENNILIPGHRFVPFMNEELFPSEITLKEAGARKPQSFREFSGMAEDIIKYHLLMGAETLFDFFAAEADENISAAQNSANPQLKLAVLDMKKFYEETDFSEGDALLVKVLDHQNGIFEFHLENGKMRNNKKSQAYRKTFETALENVTETQLPGDTVIRQIQCAFANEQTLLKKPLMSLDEMLMSDSAFDIAFDQDGSTLVKRSEEDDDSCSCGHHHHDGDCHHDHDHDTLPENVTIGSGETGSLEEMLSKLYPMLNLLELDAILLDNFKNHDLDFNSFYSRAFGDTALNFADGMQEACFFNELEERFEYMQEIYPRELDDQCAPIRSMIVEFTMERCSLLAELAEMADELPIKPELFEALAEVVLLLDESLKLVNNPAAIGDDFNFEEFRTGVENALESGETALAALRGVLETDD